MLALIKMPGLNAAERHSPEETNTAAKPVAPTFEVRGYRIEGNTVLPPEKFRLLARYTGPAVDVARLREGLSELQLLYRDLGFVTIGVTLPQQRLTNGYVRVQIVQGKLNKIAVQGNRYFSSNNVLRALPSLGTSTANAAPRDQPDRMTSGFASRPSARRACAVICPYSSASCAALISPPRGRSISRNARELKPTV